MIHVIKPQGGLGNRLRVITSYYLKYIKDQNNNLIVIWKLDRFCNGFFLDYFEPILNIEFQQENKDDLHIDYNSCSSIGPTHLEIIQPLPYIIEKINEIKIKSFQRPFFPETGAYE